MNQYMNSGVLIVDDDPLVLASVQWTIARLGYKRIHTASCGTEARSLFLAHRLGLIIVDISLPDTDGRQLVREALTVHPGARAILISGFMYRGLMIPKDLYGKVELLAKPFTEEELSELLAATCSAPH